MAPLMAEVLECPDALAAAKRELLRLGTRMTAEQEEQVLNKAPCDGAALAAELLGSDADPRALTFMAREFEDYVVVIFIDMRRPDTVVPYLYAYCRVLLGLGEVGEGEHALAEVVYSHDSDGPLTETTWLQRLEKWRKRLAPDVKLTKKKLDKLLSSLPEDSRRRWESTELTEAERQDLLKKLPAKERKWLEKRLEKQHEQQGELSLEKMEHYVRRRAGEAGFVRK